MIRTPKVTTLIDMDPDHAVVRCQDEAEYRTAVAEWYANWPYAGDDVEPDMAAFKLQWFRWNPCQPNICGDHRAHIAEVDGPGSGRWLGSYVRLRRVATPADGQAT